VGRWGDKRYHERRRGVIKLGSGIVSGIVGGGVKVLGGILLLNEELFKKGIADIFYGIGGGLFYLAATALLLGQKILPVQDPDRALTKAEKDMLERVFFNSVSLYNIRIVEGRAGALGGGEFATTIGNTIYMRSIDPNTSDGRSTLVHECVHVWQYQNLGSRYALEAVFAQTAWPAEKKGCSKPGFSKPAYNWEVTELWALGNNDWNKFNREAQAEFVQDVWRVGTLKFGGKTRKGNGAFFDFQVDDVVSLFEDATVEFVYNGCEDSEHPLAQSSTVDIDYTSLATESVRSLRNRINLRLSKTL
jgi:hypothetical protein